MNKFSHYRLPFSHDYSENPGSKPEAIYHEAAKLLGTPKQDQNQSGAEVPEYQDVKNNTYAVVDKSKKKVMVVVSQLRHI